MVVSTGGVITVGWDKAAQPQTAHQVVDACGECWAGASCARWSHPTLNLEDAEAEGFFAREAGGDF